MRIRELWIDIHRALILRDRRFRLTALVQKYRVSVRQLRGFRTQSDRRLIFGARFIRPPETLEGVSVPGIGFAGVWIELDRLFVILFGLIQLRLRQEELAEIDEDLRVVRIELQGGVVFFVLGLLLLAPLLWLLQRSEQKVPTQAAN